MTGRARPGGRRDHRIRLAIHAGLPKDIHRTLIDRYGFHWHNQYGSTEGGLMTRVPDAMADELVGTGTMGVEPPGVHHPHRGRSRSATCRRARRARR